MTKEITITLSDGSQKQAESGRTGWKMEDGRWKMGVGKIIKPAKESKTAPRNPPRDELNILLEHYQNRRYDQAELLAMQITQKFPEHQYGWKILGALFGQKGMKIEAFNATQKAVQLAPQDSTVHSNLGNALRELGRLEEAEVSYRHAIKLQSDFAEAHYHLGTLLQELGRLDEAKVIFRQAILLKPDFPAAHNSLGITLKELGRPVDAEASYRKAIAIKADFAEAHNNLGNILKELHRLPEAEKYFREAIHLRKNYKPALAGLGALLMRKGNHKEGLKNLRLGNGAIYFNSKKGVVIL